MDALTRHRLALDAIDEQLIELLGRRYAICRDVAYYKKTANIPMMQSGRVEEVKRRCAELASAHQVNPRFIVQLYGLIIDEACRLEDEIIEREDVAEADD